MIDEEKLLWMFKEVHGEMTGACYAKVFSDDEGEPGKVACMKHGNICWSESIVVLMFNYLTKQLEV